MRKRTFVLLFLSLFFLSAASAAEQGFATVRRDGVNFRKTPDGDRICFLDQNTAVFILGEETDASGVLWYEVQALQHQNSVTGYLRADMIVPPSELFHGVQSVSSLEYHMLCLNQDGSVQGIGTNHFNVLMVQELTGVRDVRAGHFESLFLMEDGSVRLLTSKDRQQNFDMEGPFARIVTGESGFGGIRADGTVRLYFPVFTSPEEKNFLRDMEAELDIVTDLAIGSVAAAGVRLDGSVHFVGDQGFIARFDPVWTTWRDVRQVALSGSCLAALHTDGTVSVAVNTSLRDDREPFTSLDLAAAEDFTGVQQICASIYYVAALLEDGTVRITNFPQIDPSDLTNIAHLAPSEQFLAALTTDGQILMRGDFYFWPLYEAEGMYVKSK